jgi:hypothetical protein
MKISVSLSAEDVEFLDAYAHEHDYPSRSAALQSALMVLRTGQLTSAYEDAWRSWGSSGEADMWDAATADGLES